MRKTIRLLTSLATLTSLIAASPAVATNGYFAHGIGVKDKALAGAGVALSQDTLAAAVNPAGMLRQGERYDVGGSLFSPDRSYAAEGIAAPSGTPLSAIPGCPPQCPFSVGDGTQSKSSDNDLFVIPQFGMNWMLDEQSAVGVSVYGNGGMNTEYDGGVATLPAPAAFGGPDTMVEAPGTFGDGTAGVDLAQLFIAATYSRAIDDKASWGASLILAYQQFKAQGLANFAGFSTAPGDLSNNGTDSGTGIGLRLGIQGEVAPGITLGAAYQPQIDMDPFDDYAGLFAEDGDFDIPSTLTAGVAWKIGDSNTLLVDVQQINYEDVAAVSNKITPLTDGSCAPQTGPGFSGVGAGCLGGDDGAGFGWQNMTVVKVGYQWKTSESWTWRVGFSDTDQPVPDSETLFNILAPGVVEQHFTFGFTHRLDAQSELNFAAMYAPNVSVSGNSAFDPAQEIELEMSQYELTLGYSRLLD